MVKALQNPSTPDSTSTSSVSRCSLPSAPFINVLLPSTICLADDDSAMVKAKNPKELAMDKPNNHESFAQDKPNNSENPAIEKLKKAKATAKSPTVTKSNTADLQNLFQNLFQRGQAQQLTVPRACHGP